MSGYFLLFNKTTALTNIFLLSVAFLSFECCDLFCNPGKFDILKFFFFHIRWVRVLLSLGLIILYLEAVAFEVFHSISHGLQDFPSFLVETEAISAASAGFPGRIFMCNFPALGIDLASGI